MRNSQTESLEGHFTFTCGGLNHQSDVGNGHRCLTPSPKFFCQAPLQIKISRKPFPFSIFIHPHAWNREKCSA